jgi:hypothetical protein
MVGFRLTGGVAPGHEQVCMPRSVPRAALVVLAVVSSPIACGPPPGPREPRDLSQPDAALRAFVRVRCALDGREVFTTWRGRVFAFVPGEPVRELFAVEGMNVARCAARADGAYTLTSRELMLYLDPGDHRRLDRWDNPWSGESVTVAHVGNSPVQAVFTAAPPLAIHGALASFVIDVPLSYPNPLAADAAMAEHAPAPLYQAGEFFGLTAPLAAAGDEGSASAAEVAIAWHRVGPWLPWMKMGARPGVLVYSAHGEKVTDAAQLSPLLRAELERLPGYRHAPACYLAARNATSWTTFGATIDAYRRGDRFPPAPPPDGACAP